MKIKLFLNKAKFLLTLIETSTNGHKQKEKNEWIITIISTSFLCLYIHLTFKNKMRTHILKYPHMIDKGSIVKKHKTALSPSSVLLVQWLTFEFMSIFALASDKAFYEFFPPRQLGLILSG